MVRENNNDIITFTTAGTILGVIRIPEDLYKGIKFCYQTWWQILSDFVHSSNDNSVPFEYQ